jgi:DNA-binding transcriptional MocR family regulator
MMALNSPAVNDRIPHYERLATRLVRQIESGTYRVGDRIPSVRQAAREFGLSVTTILQAYQILEDRGWIESRPQSGYYVRPRPEELLPGPGALEECTDPAPVKIDDLMVRILSDSVRPNVVQFGAAFPDPDLLPNSSLNRLIAAATRSDDIRLRVCGIPEGIEELRVCIAQRAGYSGVDLTPDEVLITNGTLEAINLALRAVCKRGDLVAVESPAYFGVLQALEALDLQVLEIPTNSQTGLSMEALRFALEHHPVRALVLVPNFNNPTGSLMPDENKRQLAELLEEFDLPLIEDDIYGELHFDQVRPRAIRSYDRHGRVILCSSFTKDISPSLRLGWIAPGRYYDKIRRMKVALNLGTITLPQLAVAAFLSGGGYDRHLRRLRREYAQRVSLMGQAVTHHFPEGTRVSSPRGGFILWVQMPDAVDSLVLYEKALEQDVSIAPGYMFSTTDKYRSHLRLNAAFWSYSALGAVERLGRLAAQLSGV